MVGTKPPLWKPRPSSLLSGKPHFKYCIVPCCTNTTITAPDKLFLCVPRERRKRDEWTKAMNRAEKNSLSDKTTRWCCEDHFSLEEDLGNYWQWKLMGNVQKLKLKDGVVPHIFECQTKTSSQKPRKRKPLGVVPAELSPVTFSGSEQSCSNFAEDDYMMIAEDDYMKDKCIQVDLDKSFRSTGTNTDIPYSSDDCSPI